MVPIVFVLSIRTCRSLFIPEAQGPVSPRDQIGLTSRWFWQFPEKWNKHQCTPPDSSASLLSSNGLSFCVCVGGGVPMPATSVQGSFSTPTPTVQGPGPSLSVGPPSVFRSLQPSALTASPTHSTLFTLKHGLAESGRSAFDWNAFLFISLFQIRYRSHCHCEVSRGILFLANENSRNPPGSGGGVWLHHGINYCDDSLMNSFPLYFILSTRLIQ